MCHAVALIILRYICFRGLKASKKTWLGAFLQLWLAEDIDLASSFNSRIYFISVSFEFVSMAGIFQL